MWSFVFKKWETFLLIIILSCWSCKENGQHTKLDHKGEVIVNEISPLSPPPSKFPEGMVWIPGGSFMQGALNRDTMAMGHEKPAHAVALDGFFMDIHPVTNAQFEEFVNETNYKTVAERAVDWEELKQQLPPDTPKPHDSILQPGSLVFKKAISRLPNLYDFSQWWAWKNGANWKHPNGPESTIQGKGNHPVVHIAYEDAVAYCEWTGRRLPTEAEWEYAARANKEDAIFFWGNDIGQLSDNANSWEGEFPVSNTLNDGFEGRAPVMSFTQNDFGLFDMAGNVWEWTNDWYHTSYYKKLKDEGLAKNPKGAVKPYNASNPLAQEKVIKGGSFLCNDSYCASYRISARMATSTDSSMEHLGFRTVIGAKQWKEQQHSP